jgi:hypothetical protein
LQSLNEPGTGFPDGFKQLCLLLGGAVGLDIDEPTVRPHREAGALKNVVGFGLVHADHAKQNLSSVQVEIILLQMA